MGDNCPVSVIIPTMDRPATLERTLQTFVNASCYPDQIIVVDQSQTVDRKEKVYEIALKYGAEYHYRAIPSSTAARNEGLEYAKHEVVIFSDDDIDVYSETISNVNKIMSGSSVALIAGLDDNSKRSTSVIGYFTGSKNLFKRKKGYITKSILGRYPAIVKGNTDTEWAMGYFFAVKKSLLTRWEISWDERLISYAYAEDLDFSMRYCKQARKEGLKCVLSDQVRVKHMVSQEYRVPTKKSTYMYVIHRRYIAAKNKYGSHAAISWWDYICIAQRIIKHQNYADYLSAMRTAKTLSAKRFEGMEDVIRKA